MDRKRQLTNKFRSTPDPQRFNKTAESIARLSKDGRGILLGTWTVRKRGSKKRQPEHAAC